MIKTFKEWLKQVEADLAAEVATSSGGGGSTTTADIAGNPYGSGITYTDPERKKRVDDMNGGRSNRCTKDNGKCGLGGDGKIMMKFNKATVHDTP
jgi:hypothetical protein